MAKNICPYLDEKDKRPCDNRVGKAYTEEFMGKFPPRWCICAACLEGYRTRMYVKKLIEG